MSQEQKDRIAAIISTLSLIVTVIWFIAEPKFEILLLALSTIATTVALYAGRKRAERIEARYVVKPDQAFRTSVALWGPTSSGKTWLLHAFGRTLYKSYRKPIDGLIYDFKTITGYDFSKPSEVRGTEGMSSYLYLFERARTSFDDYKQTVSSYKHEIVIFDHKGSNTIE